MPSDDSPGGGILGAGEPATAERGNPTACTAVTDRVAESPGRLVNAGGGVGDSPVRGTLLERGNLEGPGIGQAAAGLVASGPAQRQVGASLARDLAVAQKASDRVRRRAERIEADALLGPNFDPAGPKPEGMSERRWRVIKASWANMKAQPAWLTLASKVADSYRKTDAVKDGPPVLNSPLIQINILPGAQLPVRKIRD